MDSQNRSQELGDQDRLLLVFGYLGPLALVALLASRREFVKWHAKQGLLLTLSMLVVYAAFRFMRSLLSFVWVWMANVVWAALLFVAVGALVAMLVAIVRGIDGERFKLPLLGDLADKI